MMAALAAVGTIASFAADGEFSQNDILGSVAAIVGVLAVYAARNTPTVPPDVPAGVIAKRPI